MSMSIDYGKLDRVYAFADFLDLLSNPAAMQQTVKEYKEQAEVLKGLIEAKTAVTEVDSYVSKQKREVEDLVAAHTEEVKKSNENIKKQLEAAATQQEVAYKKLQEAEEARTEAVKKEEAAKLLLSEAQKERAAVASELSAIMAERKALSVERQTLAAKAEQLRSVIGG